ncbi:translation elongation factor Ts [Fructilactobacillus sanfranciscensis]|uniref:Elongation factor Ts n=3 Tax=Fructilactobacillus sanfranciscensis TaxID=1625 RepID=G2KUC8_FRUST|nr:translation elongation factor Ts [Fructilactobacillus sanfranciscensis]AEN99237.1 Elongation factor Ts [Fructilactobacillus sanfranciscensis TMW 1.1304]KRM80667.1 elongation factor Ts [Fructilactobacillus sanfranciscensis DSM 20451]MCG7194504.1 elongation factor Ts [Fructilactobacillus sanfranciscensis]MCG7195176.1 elongation factor Ts [Fructilactobacillus sanfranciscensis]MDN4461768.1 elongation factor Ts [Fructilactobacillus sanfranciscensis]
MAKITAQQVKDLREKTSAGMMDAKKALVEADGDEKKAMEILREKGVAKAQKKSGNTAANGLTKVSVHDNKAAIVEINSETDFVAANDDFKNLVDEVGDLIALEQPKDVEAALKLHLGEDGSVEDTIIHTSQITGEKVSLRRFAVMNKNDGESFGAYLHNGGEIGVLVKISGADKDVAKDVAMHIAATNPEFLSKDDISAERLQHEKDILTKEALAEGKPANIVEKMVTGRVHKFLAEICLVDQPFVKDPDQTVGQYVDSKGGKVEAFVRYQVGEGIDEATEAKD